MSKKTEKLIQQAQHAYNMGHHEQARACYEAILAKKPRHLDARYLLGTILAEQGRFADAQLHLEMAAQLAPDSPYIQNNLGNLYLLTNQHIAAEQAYRRALRASPGMTEALTNLGNLLVTRGALTESVAAAHQALAARPRLLEAHVMLANAYRDRGDITRALEHYRHALEIAPGNTITESNLLMTMNYHAETNAAEVHATHRDWGARLPPSTPRPARPRAERLRIGYISPDLGRHPVGYLMEGLLAAHDRSRFEIRIYSDMTAADDVTARLRAHCDAWRDIAGLDHDRVAAILSTDGLDIAIDLTGHTARNRLPVFARRVAPVQASYLGYCTTTGVPAMDYAISDTGLDPADADAAHYTETLWRLDRPSFAFVPDTDFPAVGPLPAAPDGGLTFGAFNTLAKVSDAVLDLWADVLVAVPKSKLVMQARALSDAGTCERIRTHFALRGVAAERVELLGFTSLAAHLAQFNRVDVCLDTFPWNGHMTTLDSLWMGVPVLTLAGDRRAARMGACILGALGMEAFVASSPQDFVSKAVALDADRGSLAALRAGLRERIGNSPVADGVGLARALESAYTTMHETALNTKT